MRTKRWLTDRNQIVGRILEPLVASPWIVVCVQDFCPKLESPRRILQEAHNFLGFLMLSTPTFFFVEISLCNSLKYLG